MWVATLMRRRITGRRCPVTSCVHRRGWTSNEVASTSETESESSMPKALRVTSGAALPTRGAEKDRLWERMMTMARQHVGVMETYDADVEEAVRRAVRDAFSGGDSGIRVGRRARARFEALRKTMRRRSGGAVSSGLLMDNEDNMRLLNNTHRGDASAAVSLPMNDVALLDAFDGEDDIEWGARLSKRKLRRLEASTAMTTTSSLGENDLEMIKYEELDAAVYAVMRSPMTMGALKRIFYETRDRLGDDFKPRTVLDFGSGPIPSTLFAARAVFGEDVGTMTSNTKTTTARGKRDAAWNDVKVAFVDSNPGMMRFARRIVGYAEKIAEERRLSEAATTNTATEKVDDDGGDDARRETSGVVAEEDEDGIIRLDFSDFETGDARKSSDGVVARASSAIRLKTPHPWHESEGVRTSASLHGANRREGFDMVVSSYALGEIPEGVARVGRSGRVERNQRQLDVTIRQLWDKVAPGGILVIAEPGTPRGSALVRRARALVLEVARRDAEQNARRMGVSSPDLSAVEAYVVAPCQHDGACPIKEEHREDGFATWCHFPQRALRSKYAREMNQSARPYQDEKFSYVVLRKQPRAEARRRAARAARRARDARVDDDSDDAEESHHESVVRESVEEWSRVIRSPKKRKGHVVVELCTARGEIERAVIAKSHGSDQGIGREGYKFARKLRWGDLWPFANKTVTKPGDQRRFELEAARFYAEHAARIEAAAEPSRRYIGEPMDPALQAFIDDELDDEDASDDDDDDVDDLEDDDELDEDILALFQNVSVEDLAALRRRARADPDPSNPPPSN